MRNVDAVYPLTAVQNGILSHCLRDPDSDAYLVQMSCTIVGELDPQAFHAAWGQVFSRHAMLRSIVIWDKLDQPVQVIRSTLELPWVYEDWRARPPVEQDRLFSALKQSDKARNFDLARGPLLRLHLLQTGTQEFKFLWTMHHILLDGWSTLVLMRELTEAYASQISGALQRSEMNPSYAFRDFVGWLQQQDQQAAHAFWRERLRDMPALTDVRWSGQSLPGSRAAGHKTVQLKLDEQATARLSAFARHQQLTFSTLVQGAWALLLGRLSGADQVVFGLTVAGRPPALQGAGSAVGMFINTLPVITSAAGDQFLIDWLRRLQQENLAAQAFEHVSLADMQRISPVQNAAPLFESIVVSHNFQGGAQWSTDHWSVDNVVYDEHSHYPLALLFSAAECVDLQLVYDSALYTNTVIDNALQSVASLLTAMAGADGGTRCQELDLLTAMQLQQLTTWEAGPHLADQPRLVHALLVDVATRCPNAPAVVSAEGSLSYAELMRQSASVSRRLAADGLGPGDRVALLLPAGGQLIACMFGVLRLGAAYIALDPDYAVQRNNEVLAVADARAILTSRELCSLIALPENTKPLYVDNGLLDSAEQAGIKHTPQQDSAAYIVFTSGTSGRPKGVIVTQRNLAYSTAARRAYYGHSPRCFLLLSSPAFDSAVAGIFWTLCGGGTLLLGDAAMRRDPELIASLASQHQVTHTLCLPTLYSAVLEIADNYQLASLRTVIVAGESCPQELQLAHYHTLPGTSLFNEYGPSEATVWSTVHALEAPASAPVHSATVSIGRPIPGSTVYIVDPQLRRLPPGFAGELCIAGPGVAAGYLASSERAADERFIVDPFNPEGRIYRSGDMARFDETGKLHFLGRNDRQVKIRGFRVELDEVEHKIASHPQVLEAAVKLVDVPAGPAENESGLPLATDVAELQQRLSLLPESEAQALLAELEQQSEEAALSELLLHTSSAPHSEAAKSAAAQKRRSRAQQGFAFELICDPDFIRPPRDSQREWLIHQALDEVQDDLLHLHSLAARFVPGRESRLRDSYPDIAHAELTRQEIMEDWQTPLMRAMAEQVTANHGDILEIGFGRGVSATMLQDLQVKSHTIIESSDFIVAQHYEPWLKKYPGRDIRLLHGRWQDQINQLQLYDGIFFHAFPLNEQEFVDYVLHSITFAEHAIPALSECLKPGGAFTYLSTEVDSLSRRHQRLLNRYFSTITTRVMPLQIPADTEDAWWADSMLVVKAVK